MPGFEKLVKYAFPKCFNIVSRMADVMPMKEMTSNSLKAYTGHFLRTLPGFERSNSTFISDMHNSYLCQVFRPFLRF
eukprot:m.311 g.311  ORF g.311 m.311 type:complete len:77 (+) comp1567_c0_seq2:162-392(+)